MDRLVPPSRHPLVVNLNALAVLAHVDSSMTRIVPSIAAEGGDCCPVRKVASFNPWTPSPLRCCTIISGADLLMTN